MEAFMTVALLDERIPDEARKALERAGYHTILIPSCDRLPRATASHPDMLAMRIGDKIIAENGYAEDNATLFEEIASLCPGITVKRADIALSDKYPGDCRLNALLMSDRLFARTESVATEILTAASSLGMKIIDVRQGYPACTVLALGDSHAITADCGMARALRAEGIEVLLIDDGGILLPPYDYGFVGGAAGVHGNKVYFIGDLATHGNFEEIRDFCKAAGYEPTSLISGALLDLGRIIFIDSEDDND